MEQCGGKILHIIIIVEKATFEKRILIQSTLSNLCINFIFLFTIPRKVRLKIEKFKMISIETEEVYEKRYI